MSPTQSDKTLEEIVASIAYYTHTTDDVQKAIAALTAREERMVAEAKLALLREAYKRDGVLVDGISPIEQFIIDEMVELESALNPKEPRR